MSHVFSLLPHTSIRPLSVASNFQVIVTSSVVLNDLIPKMRCSTPESLCDSSEPLRRPNAQRYFAHIAKVNSVLLSEKAGELKYVPLEGRSISRQ